MWHFEGLWVRMSLNRVKRGIMYRKEGYVRDEVVKGSVSNRGGEKEGQRAASEGSGC